MDETSITEYMGRAKRGEPASSYSRLLARVARYARKVAYVLIGKRNRAGTTPTDVGQEVALKVARSIGTFDGDGHTQFFIWVRRIAIRTTIDVLRKTKPGDLAGSDGLSQVEDGGRTPYQIAEDLDSYLTTKQAIDNLDDRKRSIIALKIDQNKSFEEIADMLGMRRETVRNWYHNACKRLRETRED